MLSAFSASPQWTTPTSTREILSSKQKSVSQSLFQPITQTHLQPVTDSVASDSLATLEEMVLESVRDTQDPIDSRSDDTSVTDSAMYEFCDTLDDASMSATADNCNAVDGIEAARGNVILGSNDGPLSHEAPNHSHQQQCSAPTIHLSPHPRNHAHAVLEEVVLESMPNASDQHRDSHYPLKGTPGIYMASRDTRRVTSEPINTKAHSTTNNIVTVQENSISESVDAPQYLSAVPAIAFGLKLAQYECVPPLPTFATRQYEHQTQTATEPSRLYTVGLL